MANYGEIIELLKKPELRTTAIGGYDKSSVAELIAKIAQLVTSAEEGCEKEKEILLAKVRGAASIVENIEKAYKANLHKVTCEADALRENNRLLTDEISDLKRENEVLLQDGPEGYVADLPTGFASADEYIESLREENEGLRNSVKDAAVLIDTYETQYGLRLRRAEERCRRLEKELELRRTGGEPAQLEAMIRAVESILDKRDAILRDAKERAEAMAAQGERHSQAGRCTASSYASLESVRIDGKSRRAIANHVY